MTPAPPQQPEVSFRDPDDIDGLRQAIFDRAKAAFESRFPLEHGDVRIEAANFAYDPKTYGVKDAHDAIMSDGRLAVPLRADVRLVDARSGEVIDERPRQVLANIPWLTHRGTVIHNGNEYSAPNQLRLKPGGYARRKDSGEYEYHINPKAGSGPTMRLFMEPDTGVFRASIDQSRIKLYPVLKAMGVSDTELAQAWGPAILEANQKATDRQAFGKFYRKFLRSRADDQASPGDQVTALREALDRIELDEEVVSRSLGEPHGRASTGLLVKAATKLLAINRGEAQEDDRDSMLNRTIHGLDDYIAERIEQDAGKIGRTLAYRARYNRSLDHLKPGLFSKQIESLYGTPVLQLGSGINPVEFRDQMFRVIQTGPGGISSIDLIPDASRNVHPTQLGMIDPIRTTESLGVGIDQRIASRARIGSDHHLYFPVRDRRTGERRYIKAPELHNKTLAFPKTRSLLMRDAGPAMAAAITGEETPAVAPQGPGNLTPAPTAADLLAIKRESDRGNFKQKAHELQQLAQSRPEDWMADSEMEKDGRQYRGLTHKPTGFKFHLPVEELPQRLREQPVREVAA